MKRLIAGILLLLAGQIGWAQETVRYVHTDALGSPVAYSNAAGVVTERIVYEPYGGVVGAAPVDDPGFTGHVRDGATSLNYMQQRYYDSNVGVFLSVDPVKVNSRDGANFNGYKYAGNNPYRFTDPDGRMDRETRKGISQDRRSIAARCSSCSARMTGSAHGVGGSGVVPPKSESSYNASGSGEGWGAKHIFEDDADRQPTFNYAIAAGVGVKAQIKEGADNDRYSITTPSLGATAAGMFNVFTIAYDFKPIQSMPVDVGLNLGGEFGLIGVLGAGFRYVPPGRFEFAFDAGLGVAARVEMFEVGFTPGKVP